MPFYLGARREWGRPDDVLPACAAYVGSVSRGCRHEPGLYWWGMTLTAAPGRYPGGLCCVNATEPLAASVAFAGFA
jgi:hypothetical protein